MSFFDEFKKESETKKLSIEWAKNDAKRDAGINEPENINKQLDISYGPYGKENLLDVYRPKAAGTSKLPVIFNIHGGGYFYGNKELYRLYCLEYAKNGFAVVNINYRLAPAANFPAPLEDINNAATWIVNNASEYGLDIDNVFMIGDSAGAQLTSHYCTILTNPAFAKLFDLNLPDINIKAVALACGLYNIKDNLGNDNRNMLLTYLGENFNEADERINVLDYITNAFPPSFIFSSHFDFLFCELSPLVTLLEKLGVKEEHHIFGDKNNEDIAHVFHLDLKLEEGHKANDMQMNFFRKMM